MSKAQRSPFSSRSALSREPNALSIAMAEAQRRGRQVLDLTLSNPTRAEILTPGRSVLEVLGARESVAMYTPSARGETAARQALAAHLGCSPEQLILTASTSEAYGLLFKLLASPHDSLLAPRPSYPLLDHLAHFDGLRLHRYDLAHDDEWRAQPPEPMDPGPVAVISVSPNNPTGSILTPDCWEVLGAPGRPVIVDEVFADFVLEGAAAAPPPSSVPLRFHLGGLSKSAGLPQLKLAWIRVEGHAPWVEEAVARLELLADAYLSLATPVQRALPTLLRHGARFQAATRARLEHNLSFLRDAIEDTCLSVPRVDGGWYAALRVPAILTDEAWALALLKSDVLVQPGYFYDFPHGQWLVVSLLTPTETFRRGLGRLLDCIAQHTSS